MDRAFIIRFPQDNTFVTLDYKSPNIIGLDLVERLGLAKADAVTVRCSRGSFKGKLWFLGTHEEVKVREKDASELMARIDAGEDINLSSISLGACSDNLDQCPTTSSDVPPAQEMNTFFSDSETEDVITQSKRKRKFPETVTTSSSLEEQLKLMTAELSKSVSASDTVVLPILEWFSLVFFRLERNTGTNVALYDACGD